MRSSGRARPTAGASFTGVFTAGSRLPETPGGSSDVPYLLVQRRAAAKETWPGKLDVTAARTPCLRRNHPRRAAGGRRRAWPPRKPGRPDTARDPQSRAGHPRRLRPGVPRRLPAGLTSPAKRPPSPERRGRRHTVARSPVRRASLRRRKRPGQGVGVRKTEFHDTPGKPQRLRPERRTRYLLQVARAVREVLSGEPVAGTFK